MLFMFTNRVSIFKLTKVMMFMLTKVFIDTLLSIGVDPNTLSLTLTEPQP